MYNLLDSLVDEAGPAALPKYTLLAPVDRFSPAFAPNATLKLPEETVLKESCPIETVLEDAMAVTRELIPKAVLFTPVIFLL